ncbi:hypothetical protein Tco_0309292 [Tanacetum coccineum]
MSANQANVKFFGGPNSQLLPFTVVEPADLDLPAEKGLSGELGLELDPAVQGVEDNAHLAEAEDVVDVERKGVKPLRVGVDGREGGLIVGGFIFPGFYGREPGVEGRVFWEGLVVLPLEEAAGDGRVLEGVEPREGVVWADGVDGHAVVDER